MATQLQIRRGTSTQVAAFTGAEGEIVVNTTNDSVHVNDGSTAGGFELARVDGSNWAITNAISTTANISFGDNDKAIFGAGSDLQIYHDGTDSYITEVGNGNLIVKAAGGTLFQGATAGESLLTLLENGAVTAYYDNAVKLATTSTGIDVTGTVTADGGTIVSTSSDAFSSKAVGGYAIQAYQDATSSGHTALDLRSDATTDTRYLIRGYNDASGTPTEVFSVGADGTVTADGVAQIGGSTDLLYLSGKTGTHAYVSLGGSSTAADFFIGADTAIPLIFRTDATERMRISGGNLLVGKTTTAFGTVGIRLEGPNGKIEATRSNNIVMDLNRLSTDGTIANFSKDGSPVGSIGTSGGDIYLSNGTKSLLLTGSTVLPRSGTGGLSDNTVDLGNSNNRFKDLYLSGGAYLGGTAAANKLDYYEETAWTPTQSGVTLSVSVAKAVRIGNLVTLACRVAFPSNSDSTLVGISGLPFTRDTNWQSAGAVMATFVDLPSGYTQLNYFIGGSTIQLYAGGDDLGWDSLTNSDMSGGQIILNVTYQTNA